ncbi:hypothetical protein GH714_042501 [Hevea brasiliensis]|uniref:Uncharacterized protein n=1 Tax=Hevea brasiliensis TaxID=3981 RepID=A0A6A6JZ40_HEVBR|nr:hypothetical protein GH714_042501 [Hevea brasiliensis]
MGLPAKYYGYVSAIGGASFIAASDVVAIAADYYFVLTPVLAEAIWIPSSFCISFITSNSVVLAFREVSNKGAASSFIICCQTVFGVLGMYVVGKLYDGTIVPICLLTLLCCAISAVIMYRTSRGEVGTS